MSETLDFVISPTFRPSFNQVDNVCSTKLSLQLGPSEYSQTRGRMDTLKAIIMESCAM